ncbi:MAG: hypothetical protein QXT88_02825 [Desulfurococcaceae archaeon]|uniref:Uncharacterized protein n=1 Tax=Staphylothermus marinus TaxID=2280 RepID=A0A7C4NLT2_STAMA
MDSKLGERTIIVKKRLRRVLSYAANGFYLTLTDEDKIQNRIFLEIIKEAYKALQVVYGFEKEIRVV